MGSKPTPVQHHRTGQQSLNDYKDIFRAVDLYSGLCTVGQMGLWSNGKILGLPVTWDHHHFKISASKSLNLSVSISVQS